MSSCRSCLSNGLLLLVVTTTAQADWFGPPCPGPELVTAEEHEVLLNVRRYETDAGEDLELRVLRDGRVQLRPEQLAAWGVAPAAGKLQPDGTGGYWLALDDVPGLVYRHDRCTQELLLDLSRTVRAAHVRIVGSPAAPLAQPAEVPGGYLNLDVQAVSGEQPSWSALTELGAFAGAGHGTISMLARDEQAIRLDTHWTLDDPAQLRQWVIGDGISREAPGRRSVRFGGLSWGTEFRLQPDVVTFPLPALRGDAVLPSTVEVYVDGVLRQRDEVPAGPFELQGVPVTSGGGEMRAVVRDLLGREQTLAQPFYVSPRLLREGLDDFRFEAGWLRQAYGLRSNDYGEAFAAGVWRRGLSEDYTAALGADVSEGRQAAGAGLLTEIGGAFSAGTELAASHAEGGAGAQLQVGAQHNGGRFSAALDLRTATPEFSALGESRRAARYALGAYAGLPLRRGDSLAATVVLESRSDEDSLRLVSLNYSARLGTDWLLGAQVSRTESTVKDWVGGLSLVWLLGRGSASGLVQRSGDSTIARASWQQAPQQALGFGYQLDVEHARTDFGSAAGADSSRGLAQLRWVQERGVLSAAAEAGDNGSAVRYGLQTGFALLGGSAFVTRPVQGSFAVVEAGGIADVRVYRDHQLVARTNESGRALVPELRPYEFNRIGLELSDLPIEQRADAEQLSVVPYARSGALLKFPVSAPARQRWLRLRLDNGGWLPAGADIELEDGTALVGTEGRVLLQGVGEEVLLQVRWSGGRCRSQLRPRVNEAAEEVLLCSAY